MKKRYYTPSEVEKIFEQARDKDFIAGEESITKTIVESAKRNGRIGDKILLVVSPQDAHIPNWQRTTDLGRASTIGANYNKYKWEVPKLVYINGKLICADGVHRLLGAVLAGISDVVVEILEISEQEAIRLFLSQTKDRSQMRPKDYYKAAIALGEEDYVAFRDICHKHNVQILPGELENPVGTFTSILDGVNMDKKTLDKILTLINDLRWNGRETDATATSAVYSSKIIRTMKKLYAYYQHSESQLERILLQNCKGTEWYLENLNGMPQYYIFDKLNNIVHTAMAKTAFVERNRKMA